MIKMVKMVDINISDQQRALDFYTEKFELRVPGSDTSWGTSAIFKDPDGKSFVLSSLP